MQSTYHVEEDDSESECNLEVSVRANKPTGRVETASGDSDPSYKSQEQHRWTDTQARQCWSRLQTSPFT